jgi:hypothetical protein
MAHAWHAILQKYSPTIIGECQKAIKWSESMTREWLKTGMFRDNVNAPEKIKSILNGLGSHAITLAHDRHISLARARDMGIKVTALEENPEIQDAVLSAHHLLIQTLSETSAFKIIENHKGIAFIQQVQQVLAMPSR